MGADQGLSPPEPGNQPNELFDPAFTRKRRSIARLLSIIHGVMIKNGSNDSNQNELEDMVLISVPEIKHRVVESVEN